MTTPVFRTVDELRARVNEGLKHALLSDAPGPITDAMEYALVGGGKRFRPVLTLAVAEAVAARDGKSLDDAVTATLNGACALEFIHTYSLVHDDLPAMDDDVLRRGRPTTHVVHGDGMAILAGDGLLTHAFWLLCNAAPPEAAVEAIRTLARAAGAVGMVGGQAIDLIAAGRVPSYPAHQLDDLELNAMHFRKTGALICAAAEIGGILNGADQFTRAALHEYATEVGMAFQIIDDVLDVESSAEDLGKTPGKDAAAGKPTYVSRYGVDGAVREAADCIDRARGFLAEQQLNGRLPEIAEWTISRKS